MNKPLPAVDWTQAPAEATHWVARRRRDGGPVLAGWHYRYTTNFVGDAPTFDVELEPGQSVGVERPGAP